MKTQIENEVILISDSHHGIYIPQIVVTENLSMPNWNFSECNEDDIKIVIEGPDNEWYWDAWNNILDNVIIYDNEGEKYFLCHNEDLWAVPENCANQLEDWII